MTERTTRLRQASLAARPALSAERAVLLTEFYQAHEGKYSIPVMRARAFRHLCEHKTLWIGEDELIVGERGPAPKIVPTFPELTCHSVEDLEILNSRPKTHYDVDAECLRLYREQVIPYWRGRSMRDRIFAELPQEWQEAYAAGLFTEFMEQRAPGHTVLDDKIYRKGMLDFKRDIAEATAKLDFLQDPQALDRREALKSFDISCDALIVFAERHAAKARELAAKETRRERRAELEKIADVCARVPAHAPRDFQEALQYYWFCHLAVVTELNGWDSFNPGHLDQHLLPFYEQGLADGTLTKERARELLECFFIKFNNHPAPPKVGVTAAESGTYTDFANINIGGLLRNGSDGSNEVSHILLDIVDEMHLLQPSTNIQLSRKSPDHFLKHALRVVSKGYGFPSIFNADAVVQEQLRQGKSLEDARAGGCSGCVEVGAFGKEAHILTGYFNMPKCLELALHNGVDPMTGKQLGPRTGVLEGAEALSLSPQRGEGRGEGCDRPTRSPGDADLRLLTPALSSIEEERERGLGAGLDKAAGRALCPQPSGGGYTASAAGEGQSGGAAFACPVIRTFEDLFAAYRAQFKHFLEIKLRGNLLIERMYATRMPAPFLSVLTDDCIARGRDYNAGGARYNNTYIQFVGLGSLTDSLSAVKQMCFETNGSSPHPEAPTSQSAIRNPQSAFPGRANGHGSLRDLVSVLEKDFAGEEPLRQRLINKTHKYGNDDDYADAITVRIFNTCFEELDGRPDTKGGRYRVEMLPTTCHVYFGSVTGATPDGRHARRPLSEGISPVQGADRLGPTAVIKSAAKMDHLKTGGTLLNMKFTPNLVATDDGLDKWAHLVRSYFKMDGHHVQFNVVRADTLRQAQAKPDEHRDLIVRVAGYSDYFCDLSKELQEEIIERTEHQGF